MKITQLNCDWKDVIGGDEMKHAVDLCGGPHACVTPYDVSSEVDSHVLVVSSEPLTSEQLDELWRAGDLATGEDVWQDDTFDGILAQLRQYIANEEATE